MSTIRVDRRDNVVLITGSAGFIGSNLVMELLRTERGIHIVGLDNMNDYYDVSLKEYRFPQGIPFGGDRKACRGASGLHVGVREG